MDTRATELLPHTSTPMQRPSFGMPHVGEPAQQAVRTKPHATNPAQGTTYTTTHAVSPAQWPARATAHTANPARRPTHTMPHAASARATSHLGTSAQRPTGSASNDTAPTSPSPATQVPADQCAARDRKLAMLEAHLVSLGPLAIGFSGGVDSTFLAAVCARCKPHNTLLVHMTTPFSTTPELQSCEREAELLGLPIAHLAFDPFSHEGIVRNGADRCYRCKRAMFAQIIAHAHEQGFATVIDGSNADDSPADRPGMQALRELRVRSPLRELGWSKCEERDCLRIWGHDVWNMPAGACLATRIAREEPISLEALSLVRAAENHLHGLGLAHVRVRLERGAGHIYVGASELRALSRMNSHDAPTGDSVPLPSSVVAGLRAVGLRNINPIARLY